jgi:hypothetical protein
MMRKGCRGRRETTEDEGRGLRDEANDRRCGKRSREEEKGERRVVVLHS